MEVAEKAQTRLVEVLGGDAREIRATSKAKERLGRTWKNKHFNSIPSFHGRWQRLRPLSCLFAAMILYLVVANIKKYGPNRMNFVHLATSWQSRTTLSS